MNDEWGVGIWKETDVVCLVVRFLNFDGQAEEKHEKDSTIAYCRGNNRTRNHPDSEQE